MDLLRSCAALDIFQVLDLSCVAQREFKVTLQMSFPLELCSAQLPAAV